MHVERIDHVGIRVSDPEAAVAFYGKLGFRLVSRFPEAGVLILRSESGTELNLITNGQPLADGKNILMDVDAKHPGHTHFALRVTSLDEALAILEARGVKPSDGPVRLGDGMSAFVRDPDRNVIELREAGVVLADGD